MLKNSLLALSRSCSCLLALAKATVVFCKSSYNLALYRAKAMRPTTPATASFSNSDRVARERLALKERSPTVCSLYRNGYNMECCSGSSPVVVAADKAATNDGGNTWCKSSAKADFESFRTVSESKCSLSGKQMFFMESLSSTLAIHSMGEARPIHSRHFDSGFTMATDTKS